MSKYHLSPSIESIIKNNSGKTYYFDNNSTTLIHNNEILIGINNWLSCGNPSNVLHQSGQLAHQQIDKCRRLLANHMKCAMNEVYFTSGATESNNIVIQGIINYLIKSDNNFTIITSSFEHPSVMNIFNKFKEIQKIEILTIDPSLNKYDDFYGTINPISLENIIKNAKYPVKFMTIMFANNETGAMQNIKEIGKLAKKYNIFFHSDTTQAFGKFKICPKLLNIDALSFSAHKFHGPKGIGGLYLNQNKLICNPLYFGGEQEKKLKPGTENVALITGCCLSLYYAHENRTHKNNYILNLKKHIINKLRENHIDFELIGASIDKTLPNTLLIKFNKLINNINFAEYLNKNNIMISIGSACQTGHNSHVLNSYKIKVIDKIKIIRISLSEHNTIDEVNYLIKHLINGSKLY